MQTNFNFADRRTIIAYDLEKNDVTAKQICEKSNGQLRTYIDFNGGARYELPNTTILSFQNNAEEAKKSFIEAFNKTDSKSKIKILFSIVVSNKDACIENN